VLVSKMTLGVDSLGRRGTNKIGISVEGDVSGYTTLSGNVVLSSTVAGIQIDDTSSDGGVRLVGNTVGRSRYDNREGIVVKNGNNLIGLAPARGPSLTTVVNRLAEPSATQFQLPKNYTGASGLYVGLGVVSAAITPSGSNAATISAISLPVDGITTVTIAGGTIDLTAAQFFVNFGAFADLTQESNELRLPVGVSAKELYLGQSVSAAGIPTGTTITGISTSDGVTTITLSNAAVVSGPVAVAFGAPARNSVQYNLTAGIDLQGGTNRVVATDVANGVFDGILVSGGNQRIGFEGRTVAGGRNSAKDLAFATSNAVYGNGGSGIRVSNTLPDGSSVVIQGNYLGVNGITSASIPNKKGNIVDSKKPGVPLVWSVTPQYTVSGTTLTIGGSNFKHGLVTGRQVYITAATPTGGSRTLFNAAVTVTFVDNDTLTATLTADQAAKLTSAGSLEINLHGYYLSGSTPKSYLAAVGNLDFEGNAYGALTAVSGGSSGGGSGGSSGGGSGSGSGGGGGTGVAPGRPVIVPPVRRR
jgi:hypothetical protein